ncbi:MAG TPA: hypothetical protein VHB74_04655, partial [Devosia sp.]|nr:hypothetical protein [Devosia sp.]
MTKAAVEQTSGAPSLWTHILSRLLEWTALPLVGKPQHGAVTVVLPDGRSRTAGKPQPGLHAVLKLNNFKVLTNSMRRGTLGFAEAYINGD